MRISRLKTRERISLRATRFDKLCKKSKLKTNKHFVLLKKVMDNTLSQLLYVLLLPVIIFIKIDTMLDKMSRVTLKRNMEELDNRIYS